MKNVKEYGLMCLLFCRFDQEKFPDAILHLDCFSMIANGISVSDGFLIFSLFITLLLILANR